MTTNGDSRRNSTERICLIVNPRAGAGRAGAHIDRLEQLVSQCFEHWEIRITEAPGHATRLAQEAAEAGFDIVAAVGGDGTCHEVVNGLMSGKEPVRAETVFTVVPFGTGSDLVRSLHIPSNTEQALRVAANGETRMTDLGWAQFTTDTGDQEEVFINEGGFGASGDVVLRSNQSSKRLGGKLTFIKATLESLVMYQPGPVHVEFEGTEHAPVEKTILSTFVANGHYCGGGMWVGSGGSMQDGHFDVTILEPQSFLQQVVDLRHLYDGRLEETVGATRIRCTGVIARSATDALVPVELDGEERGHLPAVLRLLPAILPVRGAWQE